MPCISGRLRVARLVRINSRRRRISRPDRREKKRLLKQILLFPAYFSFPFFFSRAEDAFQAQAQASARPLEPSLSHKARSSMRHIQISQGPDNRRGRLYLCPLLYCSPPACTGTPSSHISARLSARPFTSAFVNSMSGFR